MERRELIFFDIDGTLRDIESAVIPSSVPRSLARLRAAGHRLGVATGRDYDTLGAEIPALIDWDVFVCGNGQHVRLGDGAVLLDLHIEPALLHRCIAIARAAGQPIELVLPGGAALLTAPATEEVRQTHRALATPVPPMRPYRGEAVTAVFAFGAQGGDFSAYALDGELVVLPGAAPYADIVPVGVSKQSGIRAALEHFGCERYVAFGDSLNDIEMLEGAGLAVAMGGAHPQLAALADHIAPPVLQDGLEAACAALGLFDDKYKS